jgi:hypothetical protein
LNDAGISLHSSRPREFRGIQLKILITVLILILSVPCPGIAHSGDDEVSDSAVQSVASHGDEELDTGQGVSPITAEKRQEALILALSSLTLHIRGEASLKPSGIAENKSVIDANKDFFGASRAIIAAAFKLVRTYDSVIGPLWVSDSPVKNFKRAETSDSDIHWAVYTVMQNIIDKTYTGPNIIANQDLFSGFKFGSSAYFPGALDAPEDPEKTYAATINASFPKTFGRDTMFWTRPARKPTGTYLAPGTVATVTVPQTLVGKGYQVRVGSHSWDFFRLPELYRLDRISLLYEIDATEIQVSSPLGGGIYIEVPYLSDNGVVEIEIKNAVPSPYFSAKSFHVTSSEEWKNLQRHHKAPWADFQTEKFMMNVPTDWIYKLEDPVSLLAEWDMSMDATNELMGFNIERGKETLYAQVDLAIPHGFHATGYPAVNAWYDPNKAYGGAHDDYLVTSPKQARYVEFHEMGHGYLFPKLESDIESTVNLLHVAVLNRKLGFSLDEAFQKSAPGGNESRSIDNAAVFWMMMQDFKNDKPMNALDKNYQHQGHANYAEVARLFGWDALANYWRAYMLEGIERSPIDNGKIDTILLRLAKAVGVDIRPLFHFWGVHPDKPIELQQAINAEELLPSMDIYRTLKKYQLLVPPDKEAFQKFALQWWDGKEDAAKNKYVVIWDNYDETYASLVQSNVQNIIDHYFPAGPPEVVGADDALAPTPNPMTFSTPPVATGEKSISMIAAQAVDDSWAQYYFTNTAGAGHDSGWQGSRVYEDTGLMPNNVYAYTVKTRDYSPEQNTSAPSSPVSARTRGLDNINPLPEQMSMKVAPVATSPSTIYMVATTASDASGVEYYFTSTVGDGHDSGWQDGASYTDTGLNPATQYSYRVTVRDKSPQGNKTSASVALSATTKTAINGPYLVMSKPVYAVGEDIVVHYVAHAGEPSRWVGIFSPSTSADLSDSDGIQYQYLEGNPAEPTRMINGNLVFNGMTAGGYQARLHYNDGYSIRARIEFSVK